MAALRVFPDLQKYCYPLLNVVGQRTTLHDEPTSSGTGWTVTYILVPKQAYTPAVMQVDL